MENSNARPWKVTLNKCLKIISAQDVFKEFVLPRVRLRLNG